MDISINGNLITSTQPNISSIGVLNSLQVAGISTMTNIYASSTSTFTNIYSSGRMNIHGNNTTILTHTGSSSEVIPLTISTPNLLSGQSGTLILGVNTTSNYNMGQISFAYNSSGSNQNRLDFGFNGIGPELSIRGDGNVGIGTTNPSQLLDVNGGNIRCSGYIKPEIYNSGQIIQIANFNQNNVSSSSVTVSDVDNLSVNSGATINNIIDGNFSTLWNPNKASAFTYKILFTFPTNFMIQNVFIRTTGDTTHDPTGVNIYNSQSKTTLYGSYGTFVGRTNTIIYFSQIFNGNSLYFEFPKTSENQIYLNEVIFNYFMPSSISDLNNLSVNTGGSLTNIIDLNYSTYWNPNPPYVNNIYSPYKLTFGFQTTVNINSVTIRTVGDTAHDPTGVNIYDSINKIILYGTYGSFAGRTITTIQFSQTFTGTSIYFEFTKTSSFQIYINEIEFRYINPFPVLNQYVFNSATYTTWVSIPFTFKSSSSKVIIKTDASYTIAGVATVNETYKIRVLDNGEQKFEKTQFFNYGLGGGTRSGVLLPLICSYNNSNTGQRNIDIQLTGTATDPLTLTNSTNSNWNIKIIEIAN